MKVALLSKWTSIHTVRWANALADRGHDVHLLTLHSGGEALDSRVTLHVLPIKPPLGYYLNVLFARWILRKEGIELLNTHFASGYGTLARLINFHPHLLSVWGSDVYEYPYLSSGNMGRIVSNLRAADRVASTSHAMAVQTTKLDPSLREIAVTPFGVDTGRFQSDSLKTNSSTLTIGTVKSLAPKYGIDTLLQAFRIVRDRMALQENADCPALKLLIVGGGPQHDELKCLCTELHIEDYVEFTGWISHSHIVEQLNRLDIYVALSRLESFGVAVLEASACGLPVVVSNVGGLPEVVVDAVTGLIVPMEDPEAAADAIISLAKDSQLRSEMGNAGRMHVIDNFSWEVSVLIMEELYLDVVSSRCA